MILLSFLLITWCWINTFKGCYHCGLQSIFWLSESIAFRLTDRACSPTDFVVSKCSRASTSNPHSLQQNSTLNGATLIFQSAQNNISYSTFHIMFIILVSAYSMLLFDSDSICTRTFLSFLWENETGRWQKCIFLAKAQEHKCTSATGIWVKKKIYRTWLLCCKFLSFICP